MLRRRPLSRGIRIRLGDGSDADYEAFCAEEDECLDDYFDCIATAYKQADCSTAEGVSAAAAEAANCINTADTSECETASGTADSGGAAD